MLVPINRSAQRAEVLLVDQPPLHDHKERERSGDYDDQAVRPDFGQHDFGGP